MSGGYTKGDEVELMTLVLHNDGRLPERLEEHFGKDKLFPRGAYIIEKWFRRGWMEDFGSGAHLTEKGTTEMPEARDQARERLAKMGQVGIGFIPAPVGEVIEDDGLLQKLRKAQLL